jgi:hypothetical protein
MVDAIRRLPTLGEGASAPAVARTLIAAPAARWPVRCWIDQWLEFQRANGVAGEPLARCERFAKRLIDAHGEGPMGELTIEALAEIHRQAERCGDGVPEIALLLVVPTGSVLSVYRAIVQSVTGWQIA